MSKQVIAMLISLLMVGICFFFMVYSYAEKMGDGSWNDEIFLGSGIGMAVSIALFFLSLIWAIVKAVLNK